MFVFPCWGCLSLDHETHATNFGHTPVTPQPQLRSETAASIRKRNGLWQVQVRSRHAGSTSKSFHRKTDAERWAIAQEALMQSGQWQEKTPSQYTIGDMLSRYLGIVTPTKRGREQEERRLQRLLRDKQLMSIRLDQAHPASSQTSVTIVSMMALEPVSTTLC